MSKVAFNVTSVRCDETWNFDKLGKLRWCWFKIDDGTFRVISMKALERRKPPIAFDNRVSPSCGLGLDNNEPFCLEEAIVEK